MERSLQRHKTKDWSIWQRSKMGIWPQAIVWKDRLHGQHLPESLRCCSGLITNFLTYTSMYSLCLWLSSCLAAFISGYLLFAHTELHKTSWCTKFVQNVSDPTFSSRIKWSTWASHALWQLTIISNIVLITFWEEEKLKHIVATDKSKVKSDRWRQWENFLDGVT